MSDAIDEFLLAAMRTDGVSVSVDDETGEITAVVSEPADDAIDTEDVHGLAHKHDLQVNGARADFGDGVVYVSIGGDGEDGDSG